MNPVYNPIYGGVPFIPAQQRLEAYEQQYPQFFQQNPNQSMMSNSPQAQNLVKCRAVTSIDEAKAAMIDLDGSVHVFTDLGNRKIYTKQINLDGTASLNTYELVEAVEKSEKHTAPLEDYMSKVEFDSAYDGLLEKVKDLQGKVQTLDTALKNMMRTNKEAKK